uniref:Uncharacterized protein n=1 Tax=Vespula pensylvanica TaxID=30213 RepID=A0A834P5L7_VESPE|nr:hypothetical protein H0235_005784 [Vespula pensylvanica]
MSYFWLSKDKVKEDRLKFVVERADPWNFIEIFEWKRSLTCVKRQELSVGLDPKMEGDDRRRERDDSPLRSSLVGHCHYGDGPAIISFEIISGPGVLSEERRRKEGNMRGNNNNGGWRRRQIYEAAGAAEATRQGPRCLMFKSAITRSFGDICHCRCQPATQSI